MRDFQYLDIYGGMDTRMQYKQSGNLLYMDKCKNAEVFGTTVRRARGQTQKIQISGTSVLGMSKHEVDGIFGLRAITGNGNYYRIVPETGVYTSAKSGLSASAKPFFFPFDNKLICLTGKDDPFIDGGTSITQTGFHTTFSSYYGTCGCTFAKHAFIAEGHLLAWSAANDPTNWTAEGDAGYKDNFVGNIVRLEVFSSYLLIFTTSDVYLLSGDSNDNFTIEHYSSLGLFSRFQLCKFFGKIYVFSMGENRGLFPMESLGDLAQIRVANPLSFMISNELIDIDKTRIDEIICVPYEDRRQIWVYVPIENNAGLYKCWIANFENFEDKKAISFYPREGNPITCACDLNGKIYTGTADGKIYQEDMGDTFDGNVIDSYVWFCPINMGSSRIKKGKRFKCVFNSYSTNKCTFMFAYDGENYAPEEEIVDLSDEYFTLDEDDLDSEKVAAVSDWISEIFIIQNKFTSVQFGIKTENAGEDYIFAGGTFINIETTNKI